MTRRGLTLLCALAALLVAAPAGGRSLDHVTIPDPAGDGTPDITQVKVGSNTTSVTFVVDLAGKTGLAANEVVQVFIDSDLNAATGAPPNGVDYALQLDTESAALFRWNGTDFVDTESQTVYGYAYKGFRIAVNRADLGLTSGTLRFWVEALAGEQGDDAPDGAITDYALSAQALRLTMRGFTAAKTIKAGRKFSASLRAHRDDLDELTSAGGITCSAKYGNKRVKVTPSFPAEAAICSGTVPKAAKGKTLKVTVTLELDGVRVTRTASIKVR
jgi:hypothetical protein